MPRKVYENLFFMVLRILRFVLLLIVSNIFQRSPDRWNGFKIFDRTIEGKWDVTSCSHIKLLTVRSYSKQYLQNFSLHLKNLMGQEFRIAELCIYIVI